MNYLSFNQFLKTYKLKNAPTSNIKLNQVVIIRILYTILAFFKENLHDH